MTASLDLLVNNSLATEGELWKHIGLTNRLGRWLRRKRSSRHSKTQPTIHGPKRKLWYSWCSTTKALDSTPC